MELSKKYDTVRMQVWVEAWTKTAQSSSCIRTGTTTEYTDACLRDFESRFPRPIKEDNRDD